VKQHQNKSATNLGTLGWDCFPQKLSKVKLEKEKFLKFSSLIVNQGIK
jgi:hypothetical protein